MAFMVYAAPLKAHTMPLIKAPVSKLEDRVQNKGAEDPQNLKHLPMESEVPKEDTT